MPFLWATRSSQQLDVQALTALAQIMLNNTFPELPALRRTAGGRIRTELGARVLSIGRAVAC